MNKDFLAFDPSTALRRLRGAQRQYKYFDLSVAEAAGLSGISRLPKSLKVLLENQLRMFAQGKAGREDVWAFADWLSERKSAHEIGFRPARVMMPDSGGLPLLGDLAAMRDAAARLGANARNINPVVPVDFIVDHSVMVDFAGSEDAADRNLAIELERNRERFEFLKWGDKAFDNLRVVPPGMGICHQINLEYLSRVVWSEEKDADPWVYPDTLVGMDSHTPMINGLGVVGWGVGGIEAGSAALGEPVSLLLPEVLGCRLVGRPNPGVNATDIVLALTRAFRERDLIGKFVEFHGPGVDSLTLPDRATISNMAPEYGATMSYFPVDAETIRYLRLTGRSPDAVALVEDYCRIQGLWRDDEGPAPLFSGDFTFDLASVEPSVAGPRQPYQQMPLSAVANVATKLGTHESRVEVPGRGFGLADGDVVIAAITSCTNTSNPSLMIGAGLLARNARRRGLRSKPWVKTSFSPGSRTVTEYLQRAGLQTFLDELGFNLTGFGCMSCMGNSGPLDPSIAQTLADNPLVVAAVLSGNRNYEGRVHPSARANFLASPPLVVAYALAGSVNVDLSSEALGQGAGGEPVYLKDIWPSAEEINSAIESTIAPEIYSDRYATVFGGTSGWNDVVAASGDQFSWDKNSNYIRRPPFFDDMTRQPAGQDDIRGARVLAMFGDALSTDHISPIGAIPSETAAGAYLRSLGVLPRDFNSYAARRLNDEVMVRGTFGNPRIRNEMLPDQEGSWTIHQPSGERMPIFDAAQRYRAEGGPLIVVAGSRYGAGSSRDWAAKGPRLLGVRAIIAESFERIHRSNLAGIGVLPLEFPEGVTRRTLELDGTEQFEVLGIAGLSARSEVTCKITRRSGRSESLSLKVRLDTPSEVDYYAGGGILHHALRARL